MSNSDKKLRIFTLAWEFPPKMSGESVVCLRTLQHSIHKYDVCCGTADDAGKISFPENIHAYPKKGKYISWPFRAASLFKKLDAQYDYKVMLSRVMPPNGHMAGLIIKLLKPKIKWAVYFSDPVWNSPFIKFSSLFKKDGSHRPNYLLMKLLGIPAKIAVKMSDILVFNNERLARYVLGKKYKKYSSKVTITPYGHEGVRMLPRDSLEDKFVLSHVGQVYGNRNFDVLIEALHLLKQKDLKLYKKIVVRQVGFICDEQRNKIMRSDVLERFELIDAVSYKESLAYMYDSDCLLIIDPKFEDKLKNIYVPVKIFDYMSAGRPFAAICDSDSATGDIVRKTYSMTAPHDANAVCRMLVKMLRFGVWKPDLEVYEQFHCRYGTKKLDKAVAEL